MAWRLANSLERLAAEIEDAYPGTTVWDIGDEDHQSGYSDHNPNSADVVCAIDVLADGGMGLAGFVAHLLANPHRDLRYVIFNRKIYQRKNAWKAQDYNGVNAHKTHVHVSVGNGPDGRSTTSYDHTDPWGVSSSGITLMGGDMIGLKRGDEGEAVLALQYVLADAGFDPGAKDRVYGPKVAAAVLACRKSLGSSATDGDEVTGTAYAQILRALIKKQAPATAPTSAQVAAAVAAYLKANPPQLPASMTFTSGKLTGVKAAS